MGHKVESLGAVRRGRTLAISLALCVALVACSAPAPDSSGPPAAGTDLQGWLDYFEANGGLSDVGEEQVEVLRAAAETGELTYEDLTGLISLTFACVEEQGLTPTWRDPLTDYGYPIPFYAITESEALGSSASQAIMDGCINRYSGLAEQLYVWQPVNAAIEAEHWEQEMRPFMLECLLEHGVQIDSDASRAEIEAAAVELSMATGPQDDPVFGPNCLLRGDTR